MKKKGKKLEKSTPHVIADVAEYVPDSMLSRNILKKSKGDITISAVDAGEEVAEKSSTSDTYIQIVDGTAEVKIGGKQHQLKLGEGMIIPANAINSFKAIVQFKMIATVIKK